MVPTLIFCADGNRKFAEIAVRQGFKYGAQMPNTVYYPPFFTDQNWRTPDRKRYMEAVAHYQPSLATVLDWERPEQLSEVLSWAEEAAQWVKDSVIIIPKVVGGIRQLPRKIGSRTVRLGYSASSSFSSTPVAIDEFRGWPVHCLGGTVRTQRWLARLLDIESADGNYIKRMAQMCMVFSPGTPARNHSWPKLREIGCYQQKDAIYTCFELTCIAVRMTWEGANSGAIREAQHDWLESHGHTPAKQLTMLVEMV